jgi:hypothetical protein
MSEVIKLPKKQKFENSSWNFKLDKVNLYAYWNDAFTKEECEKIIQIAKIKVLLKAQQWAKQMLEKVKYLGYILVMIWNGYFVE